MSSGSRAEVLPERESTVPDMHRTLVQRTTVQMINKGMIGRTNVNNIIISSFTHGALQIQLLILLIFYYFYF